MKHILIAILLTVSTTSSAGWFSQDNYMKNIAPQVNEAARQQREDADLYRCDRMIDRLENLAYENPDDPYYEYQLNLWIEKCEQ